MLWLSGVRLSYVVVGGQAGTVLPALHYTIPGLCVTPEPHSQLLHSRRQEEHEVCLLEQSFLGLETCDLYRQITRLREILYDSRTRKTAGGALICGAQLVGCPLPLG